MITVCLDRAGPWPVMALGGLALGRAAAVGFTRSDYLDTCSMRLDSLARDLLV